MKLSRTWVSVILIVALIFITGMTVKASTYSVPIIGYHEEEVDRAEGKVTGTALITDYDWSDVPLYIRIFKEGQVFWVISGIIIFLALIVRIEISYKKGKLYT